MPPGPINREVADCFNGFVSDTRLFLPLAQSMHDQARLSCFREAVADHPEDLVSMVARGVPAPREPCGDLDEALWSHANVQLQPFLRFVRDSTTSDSMRDRMFADVDCATMDERDFGVALHVATLAPRWTSQAFLECAMRREADREAFPLWTLLDVTRNVAGRERWLRPPTSYSDERTIRRLNERLPEEPETTSEENAP